MTPAFDLVVVDLDGTLIDASGRISLGNREALGRVKGEGLRTALCTGRPLFACRAALAQVPLTGPHIFCDGAWIGDERNGAVAAWPLAGEVVRRLIDYCRAGGLGLELYTADAYYAELPPGERELPADAGPRIQAQRQGVDPVLVRDLESVLEWETAIKANLVLVGPEKRAIREGLAQAFAGCLRLGVARSAEFPEADFVNITDARVSKGAALVALAGHLGIPIGRTLAIGDGPNDIPLLRAAGLGVAMGDAPAEVRALAGYVTNGLAEDGVAAALARFFPPS